MNRTFLARGLVIPLSLALGACGSERRVAPSVPSTPTQQELEANALAKLDATLAELHLTRDTEGPPPATRVLHTSGCDGTPFVIGPPGRERNARSHTCIRCELDGEANVDVGRIASLERALHDVPAALLALTKVERVAVCHRLIVQPNAGEPPSELDAYVVGGTIDMADHRVLFSLQPTSLEGDEIVHHELFHVFDQMTDPSLLDADPEWEALNPEPYAHIDERRPGFVDAEAHWNVLEDRASTYQFMTTHPTQICNGGDNVVLQKARLVRSRVLAAIGDVGYLDARLPCIAPRP